MKNKRFWSRTKLGRASKLTLAALVAASSIVSMSSQPVSAAKSIRAGTWTTASSNWSMNLNGACPSGTQFGSAWSDCVYNPGANTLVGSYNVVDPVTGATVAGYCTDPSNSSHPDSVPGTYTPVDPFAPFNPGSASSGVRGMNIKSYVKSQYVIGRYGQVADNNSNSAVFILNYFYNQLYSGASKSTWFPDINGNRIFDETLGGEFGYLDGLVHQIDGEAEQWFNAVGGDSSKGDAPDDWKVTGKTGAWIVTNVHTGVVIPSSLYTIDSVGAIILPGLQKYTASAQYQSVMMSGSDYFLLGTEASYNPTVATNISSQSVVAGETISDSITISQAPDGGTVKVELELWDITEHVKLGSTVTGDLPNGTHSGFLPFVVPQERAGHDLGFIERISEASFKTDFPLPGEWSQLGETSESTKVQQSNPVVTTQINNQSATMGVTVSDTLYVSGLVGPATATVELELWNTTENRLLGSTSLSGLGNGSHPESLPFKIDDYANAGDRLAYRQRVVSTTDLAPGLPGAWSDLAIAEESTNVTPPSAGTRATDVLDGDQSVVFIANINDRVDYKNLLPGVEHVAVVQWMDKSTGKPVEGLTKSVVFTPASGDGYVDVGPLPVDILKLVGKDLVAFEEVYVGKTPTGTPVVVHKDINDASQTVHVEVPAISSTASDVADGDHKVLFDGSIKDVVPYINLPEGDYVLYNTWVDKATGKEVPELSVSKKLSIKAGSPNGIAEMPSIHIKNMDLTGRTFVAFEKLVILSDTDKNAATPPVEVLVSEHKDINDVNQTIEVLPPSIGTQAFDLKDMGKDGKLAVDSNHVLFGGSIADTIKYTNFGPGTYEGQLVWMDQATGKPAAGLNPISFKFEVKAGEPNGFFTAPAVKIDDSRTAGLTLVAYEKVSMVIDHDNNDKTPKTPVPVAKHEDIKDKAQTIVVEKPTVGTQVTPRYSAAEGEVVDTVMVAGVEDGFEYKIRADLYGPFDGNAEMVATDSKLFTTVTFTAKGSGKFYSPAIKLGKQDGVKYTFLESMLDKNNTVVATHTLDKSDGPETVWVPSITTKISDQVVQGGDKLYDTAVIAGVAPKDNMVVEVSFFSIDISAHATDGGPIVLACTPKNAFKTIRYTTTGSGDRPSPEVTAPFWLDVNDRIVAHETLYWETTDTNGVAKTVKLAEEKNCGATIETSFVPEITTRVQSQTARPGDTLVDIAMVKGLPDGRDARVRLEWFVAAPGAQLVCNDATRVSTVWYNIKGTDPYNAVEFPSTLASSNFVIPTDGKFDLPGHKFIAVESLWTVNKSTGVERMVATEKCGSPNEIVTNNGRNRKVHIVSGAGFGLVFVGLGLVGVGGLLLARRRRQEGQAQI